MSAAALPWALTVIWAAAIPANATPFDKAVISADAKWVLHLDVDRLRSSQLGRCLIEQVLDPKSAKVRAALQRELGFEVVWDQVHSLTAYGSAFDRNDPASVLLVQTGLAVEKGLNAAIAFKGPALRVEKLADHPAPLFRINEESFVGIEKDGCVLVSKSQTAVERARAVLHGRAASLATINPLTQYPESPFRFFFMAAGAGFSEQANLPPRAAILKQADGGRLLVGEQDDHLRLLLNLRAASAEVAQQIQQIAQGLIALAALQGDRHPELKRLTESVKITAAQDAVTVSLQVPVTDVIKHIAEKN